MVSTKYDIIIIGAGLTGLALAYYLKNTNHSILILEARDRLGGRIHTVKKAGLGQIEMGATWLGKKHTALNQLLEELEIGIFEQELGDRAIYEPISTSPPQLVQLPPNTDPSYRIKGGSFALINRLAEEIANSSETHFGQVVSAVEEEGNDMLVKTATDNFRASVVVSTLPPYLLLKTISIIPNLPEEVQTIMAETHTWMGESIKVGLFYEEAFWRTGHLSGTISSNVGPIPEMYDHTDFDDQHFALKGFLNGAYYALEKKDRLSLIMQQLRKYYGQQAETFTAYEEKVWRKDALTFYPYESDLIPHQYNGHPVYRQPFFGGKFFVAGSETAAESPGYMDGAVGSANYIATIL